MIEIWDKNSVMSEKNLLDQVAILYTENLRSDLAFEEQARGSKIYYPLKVMTGKDICEKLKKGVTIIADIIDNDTVRGMLMLQYGNLPPMCWDITNFVVIKQLIAGVNYRHQGIATELCSTAIKLCRTHWSRQNSVLIGYHVANTVAANLYKSFEFVDLVHSYYYTPDKDSSMLFTVMNHREILNDSGFQEAYKKHAEIIKQKTGCDIATWQQKRRYFESAPDDMVFFKFKDPTYGDCYITIMHDKRTFIPVCEYPYPDELCNDSERLLKMFDNIKDYYNEPALERFLFFVPADADLRQYNSNVKCGHNSALAYLPC